VSNTETVKAIYEAFGRGDVATILDKLGDAFEWESTVPGTSDGRSENSSITIIASAIIKRWATRSSTASIPGRPDDEFAVGRGSVGCSITANGPRDRTVELWNTTGSRVTPKCSMAISALTGDATWADPTPAENTPRWKRGVDPSGLD
jgi:hypothetical protein